MDIADELNAAELAGLRSASPTTLQSEVFEQWNSPSSMQPSYGQYPESYQAANPQENRAVDSAMSVLPQLFLDGIAGAAERSNFQNPMGNPMGIGQANYGYMEPGIQEPIGYRGNERALEPQPRVQSPIGYREMEQNSAPKIGAPIGFSNRPMLNQPQNWNDRARR